MDRSYNGKILHIDLTRNNYHIEEPEDSFYRKYLGGRNIIGYYLLKNVQPSIQPLSPDNQLIFATSVITGLPIGGLGRNSVGSKSPVTGGWADSEVGGFWGVELKAAGYDAVVVSGKADKPVYIWINNGEVQIKDATKIWGKTTGEADKLIKELLGDTAIKIAQIGPAGEKMTQFACIIEDLHYAAGRNGLGAVMGSKNLKAIAVRGVDRPNPQKPQIISKYGKKLAQEWKENRERIGLHGTASGVLGLQGAGQLPTKNFTESIFNGAEKISGQMMTETILKGRKGCFACAIRCKRVVEAESLGYKADPIYGGPEYETVGAFGSNLCNDDLNSIAVANSICNAYGIDTISAGMSIAFLMECYEKGLITKSETDGIELKFGNVEAIFDILEKIVKREGVGDILAKGIKSALEYVGPEGEECALHVKGQYVALHEPRAKHGVGLAYAVAPGGADHLQASHDGNFTVNGKALEELNSLGIYNPMESTSLNNDKVKFYYLSHLWISALNVLDVCWYVGSTPSVFSQEEIVDIVKAATGWDISIWEVLKAGERGLTMARIFNNINGIGPEHDKIPARFFSPIKEGPLKEAFIDRQEFKKAKETYYEMMGWDTITGQPSYGRLVELGLEWVIDKKFDRY